jgi:hypothetical protein
MPLSISPATLDTAAILLLAIVAVESGGLYMLWLVRGRPATPFQVTFSRAGHAHAGVLVILSLVVQLYVDAASLDGLMGIVAREGIPIAAILMPAGFFFSSMGRGATRPNRFIWLVYAGAIALAAGAIALGVGLLAA